MIPTLDELVEIYGNAMTAQVGVYSKASRYNKAIAAVRDAVLEGVAAWVEDREYDHDAGNTYNITFYAYPVAEDIRSLKGSPE